VVAGPSADESFYLAFLVGLHVATALALLILFHAEWIRILGGLAHSAARRRIETADERLAWLLVVATIPAGLVGVAFEHALRTLFAKPLAAAIFLTGNGLVLLAGEGSGAVRPARSGWRHAWTRSDSPPPTPTLATATIMKRSSRAGWHAVAGTTSALPSPAPASWRRSASRRHY
jgi:undecaprenyl-diphosphatase